MQHLAIRQSDIEIVCVRDNRGDLIEEYPDGFSAAGHLDVFLQRRNHLQNVRQDPEDSLSGERFGDVFKGMAGKGVRHEVHAGGQEHKNTSVVYVAHSQRGGNTVHTVHVNIHKYGRKALGLKCLKESLPAREGDRFHLTAALCAKLTDKTGHLVQIFLLIIY